MDFTIDRSKWRCGYDGDYSSGTGLTLLENAQGYQCCLGQIALQLGVEKNDILTVEEPIGVTLTCADKMLGVLIEKEFENFWDSNESCYKNTELSRKAMEINDNEYFSDEIRENKLTELFEQHGHTIAFINKYARG